MISTNQLIISQCIENLPQFLHYNHDNMLRIPTQYSFHKSMYTTSLSSLNQGAGMVFAIPKACRKKAKTDNSEANNRPGSAVVMPVKKVRSQKAQRFPLHFSSSDRSSPFTFTSQSFHPNWLHLPIPIWVMS